jgi:hypothetical protein
MTEQQLSIRSTKAKALARKLAKAQRRTVTQIVEIALEHYAESDTSTQAQNNTESLSDFLARMHQSLYPTGTEPDIDLEALIKDHRKPQRPIEL